MVKLTNFTKYTAVTLSIICNTSFSLEISIPKDLQQNLSVDITNIDTKENVFNYNDAVPRLIASNVKLFTTLFGLNYLGPDFHWHTKLKYTGNITNHILNGNLYIQGGGDPTLNNASIYQILSSLERLNISAINGNIILDSSIFNDNPTYSMLQSNWYDADKILPSGLIINGNRTKFTFDIINDKVYATSDLYDIKVVNQLKLDPKQTACDLENTVSLDFNNNIVALKGNISPACDDESESYYVLKNFDYNKMILSQVFYDFNLKINGQFLEGVTPASAKLIYDYSSPSLEHVLIDMNKFSNNLYAMTIISSVGAFKTSNAHTFADGGKTYYHFLQTNNLFNPQFKLENGAGLSRYEYFSAKDITHLLEISNKSPFGSYLEASLPSASGEGTLHNKFIEFANKLKAKTGTLNDTCAYSGYFYSKNGNKYDIVIIADNLTSSQQKTDLNNFTTNLLHKLDHIQ